MNRTMQHLNPVPYHASYFGQKLHIDQNEKLVMFGVTHICATDGYSGKIVGFISMPIKNNVEIYSHLFRYDFLLHVCMFRILISGYDVATGWSLCMHSLILVANSHCKVKLAA